MYSRNAGKTSLILFITAVLFALTSIAEGAMLVSGHRSEKADSTPPPFAVVSDSESVMPTASALTVTAPIGCLSTGCTMSLGCTAEPADAQVQWRSSDRSVATVDEKGVVTGISAGTAVITASSGEEIESAVTLHILEHGLIFLSPSQQDGNAYATGKTNEREQAERMADYCRQRLELTGMEVFVCPYGKPLTKRDNMAAERNAICYVAIHTNAGGLQKGTAAYYHNQSPDSARLAACLFDHVSALTPEDDVVGILNGMGVISRNDEQKGFQEIRFPWEQGIPPVLLEVEFHDKEETARWIIDNVEPVGYAIADGILEYLSE